MIKNINGERGITLVTLMITVILLVIITSILVINSYTSLDLSNLTKLQNDIQALNDRIASYYVKTGELPVYKDYTMTKSDLISILSTDMSINDGNTYYAIDLDELDNISLNYGQAYQSKTSKDKYIINEETHVVYYLKGINYEGKEYHTIGSNDATD